MSHFHISDRAGADLREIWAFVAEDSVQAADRLMTALELRFQKLADQLESGRGREELQPGLRSYPVGTYLIFYRPIRAGVEIARVLSGYRNLEEQFSA